MAIRTLKAPGVLANEIDTSQPTSAEPTGIPAGIIGTALRGPAFVPKFFGTDGYSTIFGAVTSKNFGALAAQQWLSSQPASCVYIRVLGAGNCKARNADGTVTNAGFTVGSEFAQPNDIVGANTYANESATFGIEGRTYFLGCFMSESNGSTIFSDAGIQKDPEGVEAAIATIIVKTTNPAQLRDMKFTLISTDGTSRQYQTHDALADSYETGDVSTDATSILADIKGLSSEAAIATEIKNAIEATLGHNGKITCTLSTTSATNDTITLTQATKGSEGNKTISAVTNGNSTYLTINGGITSTAFSGGVTASQAVPILRGVLLAPSGVILHLSGCSNANGNDVASMTTTAGTNNSIFGNKGGITGSVELSNSQFTLIMNGFKGAGGTLDAEDPDNTPYITASFDPSATNYLGIVLNKDPLKIEEKGHLLLSDFPIHGGMAAITGSGAIAAGSVSKGSTIGQADRIEDVAFILSSSKGRGETSLAGVPDYEDFRDRFSAAASPFIVSQKYGGSPYNLFRFERLDDGEIDNRHFIKIEDIDFNINTNGYSSFTIVIEDIYTKNIVKTYPNISLDPSSPNYIARVIGDQKIYFDFDNNIDSQKIIVEGSFENKDQLFRVILSDDLVAGNVPKNAVPMGFRGPGHLVTSGSLLCGEDDSLYASSDLIQRIVQPPFPYKKDINKLISENPLEYQADSTFYWGVEQDLQKNPIDINNVITNPDPEGFPVFSRVLNGYTRYYPSHRVGTAPIFAKNRPGDETSNVTLLDTDAFNYNLFSLEHIKIRTGSAASEGANLLADTEYWASSSYVRSGIIVADDNNKTRALEARDLTKPGNRTYAKFIVPVINGFDGHNIFNQEKIDMTYRATKMEIDDSTNQGGLNGPTIAAYRKAIDILGSKTDVDIQILSIPGQRHPNVTDYAISAVENRFDALLVMDIEERDKYNTVVTSSVQKSEALGYGVSNTHTVNDFKNRNLDSSFAAAYFPDVTIASGDATFGDIPPSVMALGAISKTDSVTGASFYAPAGQDRSSLNSIIEVSGPRITTQEEQELIYEADINPIVELVNSGPFINGQKTLLKSQSDLSRIDIRRMLIDIRRRVKSIANTFLFEPNRESTLEKLSAEINPILAGIRNAGGISRYKVVIDTTTTTQADIENNTIRGKIYLQAVGSIEFIALDFEVTGQI